MLVEVDPKGGGLAALVDGEHVSLEAVAILANLGLRDAQSGAEIEEEIVLGLALAAAREVPLLDEGRDVHDGADDTRLPPVVAAQSHVFASFAPFA